MASKAIVPQQARGDAVAVGGAGVKQQPQKNVAGVGRNRRALNDIGNLGVPVQPQQGLKPEQQITRPITRRFGAELLAKAQQANAEYKKPDAGAAIGKPVNGRKKAEQPKAAVQKKVVTKPKPEDVIVISPDTEEAKNERKSSVDNQIKEGNTVRSSRKKVPTMTKLLTEHSRISDGVTDKKKESVVDIDADDVDNELAVVEYIEDIHKFYRTAEHETRPHDYMDSQPEINEKMRGILVDWLIEVHNRFELMPETLYLTINIIDRFLAVKLVPRKELQLVGLGAMLIACKYEEIWAPEVNDFVCISDNVYSNQQILKMEKTVLGSLGWTLTVPTPYVFLVRFIKAAIPDDELENMVFYLAELAMMSYSSIIYCPSMIAAAAVYVARLTLNKSRPVWTETLKEYTGYTDCQLIDCAKLLVTLHSEAPQSKLQVIYRKYLKAERCAVAFCSSAKAIFAAAPLS